MANYEAREEKWLNKIISRFEVLDSTLDKLEDTDGKVKHFFEQEKALHEIRVITREEKRLMHNASKAQEKEDKKLVDWIAKKVDLVESIEHRIDKLDEDIKQLDEKGDSKVKSYLEQKKAIEEIKSIIKEVHQLEK